MSELRTTILNRRSIYDIKGECPVSNDQLKEILEYAMLHSPTAFNSQSGRTVLLLGAEHKKLWEIVREVLRAMVPAENFGPTDAKINSFAAGYGTVLFYEDQTVIAKLQADFPTYHDAFPGFSANSAGMLQYVVWTMFRDAGLGASLQHYGNLIQEKVAQTWKLDPAWLLIAQMPFGVIGAPTGDKEQQPLAERVKVFG